MPSKWAAVLTPGSTSRQEFDKLLVQRVEQEFEPEEDIISCVLTSLLEAADVKALTAELDEVFEDQAGVISDWCVGLRTVLLPLLPMSSPPDQQQCNRPHKNMHTLLCPQVLGDPDSASSTSEPDFRVRHGRRVRQPPRCSTAAGAGRTAPAAAAADQQACTHVSLVDVPPSHPVVTTLTQLQRRLVLTEVH